MFQDYINADAFDKILDIPDQSVDFILTDPPYDFGDDDKHYIHTHMQRVCKGALAVFSPPENQWVLPADQYLFWIKPISTKNTSKSYSRFVEMIFLYNRGVWNNNRHWSQYTNVFTDIVDDASIHPYRKPLSMLERLVRNHTNEGDTIFDPFAGSASVLEVCKKLNRNYIGFEKDKSIYVANKIRLGV